MEDRSYPGELYIPQGKIYGYLFRGLGRQVTIKGKIQGEYIFHYHVTLWEDAVRFLAHDEFNIMYDKGEVKELKLKQVTGDFYIIEYYTTYINRTHYFKKNPI